MILSGREVFLKYLRLASIVYDVMALLLLYPLFLLQPGLNMLHFTAYLVATWGIIAYFNNFYGVYRYTTTRQLTFKLLLQVLLLLVGLTAFFVFSKHVRLNVSDVVLYGAVLFPVVASFKLFFSACLKRMPVAAESNTRNIIIAGYTPHAHKLKEFFTVNAAHGYQFHGFFSDSHQAADIKGGLGAIRDFISSNNIDEIYCSLSEVAMPQVKMLIDIAVDNGITIKFIPDTRHVLHKNMRLGQHEPFPVLTLRKTVLHEPLAQFVKRAFDVAFSLFVIITVLSWLTPLLALLIKMESKGPVFFKQSRPGLNEKEFYCFKFRSMQINETTEQSVIKNDPRVTKIGRFIRKTSIDEMPQFINVLRGEMSVVGPRPHLWSQNNEYSKTIQKYMVRLYVRPGITGLAQVRGFRGEISTDIDMINRIKYDVFYIENWSLLLDIKIITETVVNIFLGDEKAY